MATLEGLIRRTRMELADVKEPFYQSFSMSGRGTRIDLPVENVESFVLYRESDPANPLVEGTDFALEPRRGVVTFYFPPAEGDRFVAEGDHALRFTNEELEIFVREAFAMHTRNRNPAVNISSLPDTEVILVSILAQIEALWVLKSSASYDINIHAPEGMFVPRGQRFQQLNVMLQEAEARYKELSAAMGVGLYAVEMFTLRRVSRLTGRYVPIYIDREVDDTRIPQRVLPNIGNQFEPMPERTVDRYDLQVFQGRSFSETFTLTEGGEPLDLSTSNFSAKMYRTPYQTSRFRDLLPQPSISVDQESGAVTVSYTAEQTKKLETNSSYVWSLIWTPTEGENVVLLEGRIFVEQSYPRKNSNVQVGP